MAPLDAPVSERPRSSPRKPRDCAQVVEPTRQTTMLESRAVLLPSAYESRMRRGWKRADARSKLLAIQNVSTAVELSSSAICYLLVSDGSPRRYVDGSRLTGSAVASEVAPKPHTNWSKQNVAKQA